MGQTIRIHNQNGGGGAGVDSFNGRTGAVVPQTGDYNTGQVTEVTDKNYVTDAEKSTIGNTSGTNTGDETPTSVKTKYESNPNTNAYTDAEKTKLSGLESSKFLGEFVSLAALQAAFPSPSVGSYAYVDGGIGSDVIKYIWDTTDNKYVEQLGESTEETPASIKSKYESNPDTNAFTDAEKLNLSNQSGTNTGDETAGTIKTKYESNPDTNAFTDAEKTNLSNQSGTNTGDETTLSIQTKRPLKTVNSQSLEGVGNINISGFDPVAEGVLTDYIDSQNNNQQTTNAVFPNLTTYLTLIASGIDITSDYRFELSFSISINTTNRNAVVDIKDFGVSILPQVYTVEVKDVTNRKWVTISGRITPNPLGAGQIQLQLDFGADQGGGATSTMYFANISLSKIN